ncbi:hypothetical protein NPIL_87791 [Nephila pilipes]|uniref:P-type ATPase A domain-containing protein n=1 Tax=Nephila pilipes TaxID=299642 RepID=A0A8X6P0V6_NEPPI|nr:hypothetical protein NPIL_87791 [Nephila pilipes]
MLWEKPEVWPFYMLEERFATLIRKGEKCRIRVRELVVGDIVIVKKGDFIPADIRIIESNDLETDDSRITGTLEARPKNQYDIKEDPLETDNLAYFGTFCLQGYGKGIVVATGDDTILGQIFDIVVAFEKKRPFVYTSIQKLVQFLTVCSVGLGIMLFIFSCKDGWFWLDTLIYLMIMTILTVPYSVLYNVKITVYEENGSSDTENDSYIISVKGELDFVMPFCSTVLIDGKVKPLDNTILRTFAKAAEDTLFKGDTAFGYCEIEISKSEFPPNFKFEANNIPLQDLCFLGMLSIHIPVRPSAVEAVRNFRNAGIKVLERESIRNSPLEQENKVTYNVMFHKN